MFFRSAVADFTQQWSILHERHSEELQVLVETFRKRNADIRKERISYSSNLFTMWEQLLQQVEVDTHSHGEISKHLNRHLGAGLLEKTFHKKIQSRRAFLHRESIESILNKAEETLQTVSTATLAAAAAAVTGKVNVVHVSQLVQQSDVAEHFR